MYNVDIKNENCINCMYCVFGCPGNNIEIDNKFKLSALCSDFKSDYENRLKQETLDNEIATLLDEKFILDEDDLKNITENPNLELDNNGLIQSIDYYRAVIDFIKVTDAVNDFKKKVRDGLVNGYNQQ